MRRSFGFACDSPASPGVFAQGHTGSSSGFGERHNGAVLPGWTVEAAIPALIEKVRTAVTDGQGALQNFPEHAAGVVQA